MPHTLYQREFDEMAARFDALDIPADYDRGALWDYSLENASDVPRDSVIDVMIATARAYIDDRDMARDAGIVR